MIFIVSRQVIELAKLPPPVYSGDDSDAPGMRWVGRDDPFLTIQERRYPNVWRTSLYLPLTIIHPQPCTWLVVETCSNKFMNTTLDPRAFEEAWSSSHAPPVVELAKPLSVVGLFVIWYVNSHLWSPLDTMLEETGILSYPGMLQRFRSPFIHHLTTISLFFFFSFFCCDAIPGSWVTPFWLCLRPLQWIFTLLTYHDWHFVSVCTSLTFYSVDFMVTDKVL